MAEVFRNLDWSVLTNALLSVIPALICVTLHECSHGFIAYKLGDPTAKRSGRLSLNPLKHVDVFGLLMMAVFHFGWAKPVPVDMRYFRNPKRGMAITAAAGPISNVLLSCFFLFLYGLLFLPLSGKVIGELILQTVYWTAYLSLALAIFNVIPIPPLDGSKVLFSFLPDRAYIKLMRLEKYGIIILAALIFFSDMFRPFGDPLSTVAGFLFDKLFIIAEAGFSLSSLFIH